MDKRAGINMRACYNLRNCILVVYQLAFDDVTCYNAVSSNLVTASPCGAAI